MPSEILHLKWEGAFVFAGALRHTDRHTDYGIYQVCGPHPTYGAGSLLYIGRASKQTFGQRLTQEGWRDWQIANGSVTVYLGRLHGATTPGNEEWAAQIQRAERLLILAHHPAHNGAGSYRSNLPGLEETLLLNWGDRGRLLPEVSGARWTEQFKNVPGYGPYGSHPGIARSKPTGVDDIDGPVDV